MSSDPYADRRRLTFEQAEGAEPLPSQLKPQEVSQELRALLWFFIHPSILTCSHQDNLTGRTWIYGQWRSILLDFHVFHKHLFADEFDTSVRTNISNVKNIIAEGDYIRVFGFLQFVIRHRDCPFEFVDSLNEALVSAGAAYRVLDGNTIVPIASDEDGETIKRAFNDLSRPEFQGAKRHLRASAGALTVGDHSGSVRESVHAVESVARLVGTSGKLGDALTELEKTAAIHSALKRGFVSIYGYTSDEQGIRHPLLDSSNPNVDEADALFMIGACSAFVSYLIHKARLAGLLSSK